MKDRITKFFICLFLVPFLWIILFMVAFVLLFVPIIVLISPEDFDYSPKIKL